MLGTSLLTPLAPPHRAGFNPQNLRESIGGGELLLILIICVDHIGPSKLARRLTPEDQSCKDLGQEERNIRLLLKSPPTDVRR